VGRVTVTNTQRALPVDTRRMAHLARCAIKRLRIRARGTFEITFVTAQRMRTLNRAFMGHDGPTDVLSFRYDGEPVVGEILIAPSAARAYARGHGLAYEDELRRYLVHGLLHWLGHEDRTAREQARMRLMENRLLEHCGARG
jgi:probable rRNA maturation factor